MPQKPPKAEATESFGSDSFLDVIANMVGILIIISFRFDWHPFSAYLPNK